MTGSIISVSAILDVLVNNILPIFLVAAFGFLLRRRVPGLSKQTVTRVTFTYSVPVSYSVLWSQPS